MASPCVGAFRVSRLRAFNREGGTPLRCAVHFSQLLRKGAANMKSRNGGLTTFAAATAIVTLAMVSVSDESRAQVAAPSAESAHRFSKSTLRVDPETAT